MELYQSRSSRDNERWRHLSLSPGKGNRHRYGCGMVLAVEGACWDADCCWRLLILLGVTDWGKPLGKGCGMKEASLSLGSCISHVELFLLEQCSDLSLIFSYIASFEASLGCFTFCSWKWGFLLWWLYTLYSTCSVHFEERFAHVSIPH